VTATDRADNEDTSTYGIRVDNSGPEISLDYYWIEDDEETRLGEVREGSSVVFKATVTDPSGVTHVMINIDSLGWREMAPDSNESNPNTYVLFWPTAGAEGGAHVFQITTSDKLGNEASRSGLINIKEKEEKTTFGEVMTKALPWLWFFLFIIIIIVIAVLAYLGILTKWARGEGRVKDGKPPEQPDGPSKKMENAPPKKRSTPFKFGKKKEGDDVEEWESEDAPDHKDKKLDLK
jgi:hypothetical protein